MCLLTYFPEIIQPDPEALRRGALANGDGHGFAIVVPGNGHDARILVRKSMTASNLIKEFVKLREIYWQGPALFHSRITTDGVTNLFNCHPFMVGGDKRTVVGHNGILPASVRPGKGDKRSDTRIFAEEIAGHVKLNTAIGRDVMGEWMGSWNKMVVLTVDPAYNSHGYIINEEQGTWHEGVWYSNGSFRGAGWRDSYYGSTGYGYRMNGGEWERWEYCTSLGCKVNYASVSPHTLRCTACKVCAVCDCDPCECVLLESVKGKGETITVIGGSPAKGAVVGRASTAEEYRVAVAAAQLLGAGERSPDYDYDVNPDDDPADHRSGRGSQLDEVLALVDHLNAGGDIEDLSPAQQEMLVRRAHALADRQMSIVNGPESDAEAQTGVGGPEVPGGSLIKRGDPSDDQETLLMIGSSPATRGLWDQD